MRTKMKMGGRGTQQRVTQNNYKLTTTLTLNCNQPLCTRAQGRLEALSAERAMLSAQFHASQTEIEQYRSDLSAALSKAVALTQDNVGLCSTVDHSSSASSVVVAVCECLDKLSCALPDVSDQLVETKARLEMGEVKRLARSTVKSSPVPSAAATPAASVLNDSVVMSSGLSATETLSRQKRDLAVMHKKYLGGQFARSAVEVGVSGSLRSMQQTPTSTPMMQSRSGGGTEMVTTTGGGKQRTVARAPSPGTALLQERLRAAQAQFSLLTK